MSHRRDLLARLSVGLMSHFGSNEPISILIHRDVSDSWQEVCILIEGDRVGLLMFDEVAYRIHSRKKDAMEKQVGNYMVKSPYVCESDWGLQEALDFMTECEIRHLPVVDEGRLIGLISDRDLRAVISLPQAGMLTVGDIMKQEVFVARRSTPLQEILRTMQERRLGSTVIVNDEQEAIGIFTVTDAVGILADLLDEEEDSGAVLDDYIEAWEWEEPVV